MRWLFCVTSPPGGPKVSKPVVQHKDQVLQTRLVTVLECCGTLWRVTAGTLGDILRRIRRHSHAKGMARFTSLRATARYGSETR